MEKKVPEEHGVGKPVEAPENCVVCAKKYNVTWTDTHGVAQCIYCGAPYRVFHYENDKRIEKAPEMLLSAKWADIIRRCNVETGARMSAVGMGLSFPGGYDIASSVDKEHYHNWCEANRPLIDAAKLKGES